MASERADVTELDRAPIDTLSEGLSSAAAPRQIRKAQIAWRNSVRTVIFLFIFFSALSTRHSTLDTRPSLIAHLVSSVIYHADRDKGKCDLHGGSATGVQSSRKARISLRLN